MSKLHARSLFAVALATTLLFTLLWLAGPTMAQTADCTVTSTADSGPGTLRQCIADAPAGGLIDFDLTYPATITLTTAQLTIVKDLTIDGPGAENVAVSGNDAYRVFYVDTGHAVSIDGLTIRDGYTDGFSGGAGIAAGGPLTITYCIIQSNFADLSGGDEILGSLRAGSDRHAFPHTAHHVDERSIHTDDRTTNEADDSRSHANQPFDSITDTGETPGGGGLAFSGSGGVYTLTIQHTQFISNSATFVGGGATIGEAWIDISDSTFRGNESSGLLEFGGGLCIVDSVFQFDTVSVIENSAAEGGGLWFSGGVGEIVDSTFQGNNVSGEETGVGGGIFVEWANSLIITDTQIISNTADIHGAGMLVYEDAVLEIYGGRIGGNVAGGDGGGLDLENAWEECGIELYMSDVLVDQNEADYGGGIFSYEDYYACGLIENSRFESNQVITDGGAIVFEDDEIDLDGCTFTGNTAGGDGGAVWIGYGSYIDDVEMYDNEAALAGGAMFNAGWTEIWASNVYSNTAHSQGGAISNAGLLLIDRSTFRENGNYGSQSNGGAIYNAPSAQLGIDQSSFISNTAQSNWCYGGAIDVGGPASQVFIRNSTFVGNSVACNSAPAGGALHISPGGTAELLNVTFADNTATHNLDGLAQGDSIYNGGLLAVDNVIVSGSGAAGNCQFDGSIEVGSSHNLSDDATCGAAFTQVADMGLGPLGDYGGATETIPLLSGSPAIDAGDDLLCPAVDQRGIIRPFGAHCDIGAFEYSDPLMVTKVDVSDPIPAGWLQQYTIVVTNLSTEDPLTGVIVTDTLPPGMLYQGAVPPGVWDSVNKTIVWDLGDIDADDSETIQLYVHTLTNLTPGVVLENRVLAISDDGIVVSDTEETTIIAAPATPTPTSTSTPTPTATSTSTQTPATTGTPTPTSTATSPTATPTGTDVWTATPTPTATGPTPTPTSTATSGAIEGRVWVDQDANGAIGPGEVGLAGATVKLLDSASVVLETWITGANGAYAFTGLAAGAYTVQVELPTGYFATTPESITLDIAIGAIETVDFGAVLVGEETPTPTATVPADLTIDGYVSESSMFHTLGNPVAGAEVSASACDAPAIETTTAEDGYYSLTLPGGDLADCDTVTQEVRAASYVPWVKDHPIEQLNGNQRVDILLSRAAGLWNWLPLVLK